MSIATLILGESGSGKSASLRNLDPAQTMLIQAVRKPLPFRSKGWYRKGEAPEGARANVFVCDQSAQICDGLRAARKPIIVIDDFQYTMSGEFMRRSDERGFDKFTDIGRHAWDVLTAANNLPSDQRVYILSHLATDEQGRMRAKTIGKLLDEKITVEGLFSIVLRATVRDGEHYFTTRNNGFDTVKSPMDMFADDLIPNDLRAVDNAITAYYSQAAAA